jgi:hypothetical protein
MTVVGKTISLPTALAEELEEGAARRGVSFSALIAERARKATSRLSWVGSVDDNPDLSLKVVNESELPGGQR